MNETDAVSCLLCLQADEYGSMIKVCVPPGRIPPSSEKVICRLCAAIIVGELDNQEGEQIGQSGIHTLAQPGDALDRVAAGGVGDPEWDSGLPDRTSESVSESDRSEPEIATRSSSGAEASRVASAKTDD